MFSLQVIISVRLIKKTYFTKDNKSKVNLSKKYQKPKTIAIKDKINITKINLFLNNNQPQIK